MKYIPRPHQNIAYNHIIDNRFAGLFLGMGVGKTVVSLTAAKNLIDCCDVRRPLIVAPKLVCSHTWPTEIQKWDHLKDLKISVIAGSAKERTAAFYAKADVYIVSRDNINWLVGRCWQRFPFDFLIVDESSSFKTHDSKRFLALKKIIQQVYRVLILTGTPIPNGMVDLWSQIYLLDQGKRLGQTITSYRLKYFYPVAGDSHRVEKWEITKEAKEEIYSRIGDICLSMSAEDWLELPKQQDIDIEIELDNYEEFFVFKEQAILEIQNQHRAKYEARLIEVKKELECDFLNEVETYELNAELRYIRETLADPMKLITAVNAGVLHGKLLQYANGAVYDDDKNYHVVHDKKLEALVEHVEMLQGKSVIIFYNFQSDIDRIKKVIPNIVQLKGPKQIDDWNAGKIEVLLAHPAGTGHGLNLQFGGNYLFWFGVPSNLEWYLQACARLLRPGQKNTVFNYRFMIKGTTEQKVARRLAQKELTQDDLLDALK